MSYYITLQCFNQYNNPLVSYTLNTNIQFIIVSLLFNMPKYMKLFVIPVKGEVEALPLRHRNASTQQYIFEVKDMSTMRAWLLFG